MNDYAGKDIQEYLVSHRRYIDESMPCSFNPPISKYYNDNIPTIMYKLNELQSHIHYLEKMVYENRDKIKNMWDE